MAQKQPPYVGGVGTIGVGGTTFTVTGALDDTNCIEGDHVRDPATGYESRVLERLTVQTFRVPPWRGAALAGADYELYPDSNLRGGYQAAVTTQLLARLSAKGLVWILPAEFASPTEARWGADENQYVFSPSLRKWWIMQSGAWTVTGAPYGLMPSSNLSDLTSADTALVNLGSSSVGRTLFKASDASVARSTIELGNIAVKSLSEVFGFTNATESTSSTTGAVTMSGGLGVGKRINADGDIKTSTFFHSTANPRTTPQIQLHEYNFNIVIGDTVVISPENFYGILSISTGTLGESGFFIAAYQSIKMLGAVGSTISDSVSTGKLYVYYAVGYGIAVTNNTPYNIGMSAGLIRTR
ncbi:MAG: hypothetical protein WBF99_12150 [Xanthobacteraceae bacterium]